MWGFWNGVQRCCRRQEERRFGGDGDDNARSQRLCGLLRKVSFPRSFLTMLLVLGASLGLPGPGPHHGDGLWRVGRYLVAFLPSGSFPVWVPLLGSALHPLLHSRFAWGASPAPGTHGEGPLRLWRSARQPTVRSVCVEPGATPAALASRVSPSPLRAALCLGG